MQRYYFLKAVAALIVVLLFLNGIGNQDAWAGRYVLNQTPQTIERHFGRYWTRLTSKDPKGVTSVTYTYSPAGLRRVFPAFPKNKFSITFVGDRAQYLNLHVSENPNATDFGYSQADAAKFFEYIFGYQPPMWQQLSDRFSGNDTIYNFEYCLGDGVATSFTRMGAMQFADFIKMYYDSRCEPATSKK